MDIEHVVGELTIEEKAGLTAGVDMWTVAGVDRLGIPSITVTDGPNGARGSALLGLGTVTAACIPCGSALGATWNPALVEELGAMLGAEARTKACRVLLAPTINLHRSPIAGRNFECYSEDPLLAGWTAAAFVRGVQSTGVAATPKHFVGNDAEFERNTVSSDIDERTLRELYLVPFEHAVVDGGALAVMTGYNRLDGVLCSENEWLLREVLVDEWGFDGIVMTDWFGAGATADCAQGGLGLEMPGPARFFGPHLAAAVAAGEVEVEQLDTMVGRHLRVIDRLGAWNDQPSEEQSIDRPEHRELARRAATDASVLLRNDGVLPIDDGGGTVALIGPTAQFAHLMGGGSANLRPHYRIAPVEPLRDRLGDRLVVERGVGIDKTPRPLSRTTITTPGGEPGMGVELFADLEWGESAFEYVASETMLFYFGPPAPGVPAGEFSGRAHCRFTAPVGGAQQLELVQAGRARLFVDGELVLDGITDPFPPGTDYFGMASESRYVDLDLEAGQVVDIMIEFTAEGSRILAGAKLGHVPPVDDGELDRAVAAAAEADTAIVFVGTSSEWESEGHDRESMHLPGEQDEMVRRVAAANPRTIVVVNAGAPVAMDWADDVSAILQVWLGGQEMAAAIDRILFGEAEPGGRLPLTIPLRLEHNPSFGNFPGENDHVRYGEGLLMGYRWYDTRAIDVRFPFGHGLSYTSFDWGLPTLDVESFSPGARVRVTVPVTNTGTRTGVEVVQCYVRPPASRLFRPRRELKGSARVELGPGETVDAVIELDDRAFAYWDPASTDKDDLAPKLHGRADLVPAGPAASRRDNAGWYIDDGIHVVEVARSVVDIVAAVELDVTGGSIA